MGRRILIINGHPDPRPERLCAALAEAYAKGAFLAGHETGRLDVGALDFPLLRTAEEFAESSPPPAEIARAQDQIRWAEHLVIVFPLWHGGMPALLKGFFEQTFRHDLAFRASGLGWKGLLEGRSARIVVPMGMPGAAYSLLFGAHGVKHLERSILWMSGVKPVAHTFLGGVGEGSPAKTGRWLRRMGELGARAA